jgi:hypothetical protein
MLTTGIQHEFHHTIPNTTSKHPQNTPISMDDYLEIGLSLLESVSGFENCSDTDRFNTLEIIYTEFNSTVQGN